MLIYTDGSPGSYLITIVHNSPHKLSELFNCTSTEVFTLKQAQSIALQSAGTNKIGKTVRLYVNYSTINILLTKWSIFLKNGGSGPLSFRLLLRAIGQGLYAQ